MRRHTTALAVLAAAATLALTGCSTSSSGDDSTAPATDTSSQADPQATERAVLEKSVRDYTHALFGGDGPAGYKLVSNRCKEEITPESFNAMADQGHHEHGQLEIKNISVDEISGNLARVSYGVGVPQFERAAQPWTREDGTWKWDAC
ncbi:hypothetical protein [Streptomyces sp. DH37]|uniref:hypothetical protein n=1 Tax=Streptomyces sp. DH37 TaxID=3040122 RepID=UPI0024428C21|nr:hypothetical protein [Streptomyces sp. DH37]MDG9705557.1 hypothetical protein [Streptomyces sp. DH37]